MSEDTKMATMTMTKMGMGQTVIYVEPGGTLHIVLYTGTDVSE
jgi:hypothetical protein